MAASQHAPLSINSQQNASPRSELRNQGIDPHVAHASCSAGASSTGASSTGAGSGGICSGGASGAGDGSGGICSGSGGICSGSGGICSGGASSAGVCSAGACTAAPWYAEPCSAAPTAARLCAEHGEGHWERAGAGGKSFCKDVSVGGLWGSGAPDRVRTRIGCEGSRAEVADGAVAHDLGGGGRGHAVSPRPCRPLRLEVSS